MTQWTLAAEAEKNELIKEEAIAATALAARNAQRAADKAAEAAAN